MDRKQLDELQLDASFKLKQFSNLVILPQPEARKLAEHITYMDGRRATAAQMEPGKVLLVRTKVNYLSSPDVKEPTPKTLLVVVDDNDWSLPLAGAVVAGESDSPEAQEPSATREVEYYRCWGGDSGTWDTSFLDIPADTPDHLLNEAVILAASKVDWSDEPPQFVGFYADADVE